MPFFDWDETVMDQTRGLCDLKTTTPAQQAGTIGAHPSLEKTPPLLPPPL